MDERKIFHESFRREEVVAGSDRSFGLVLATFFSFIGIVKLWHGQAEGGAWLAVGLVVFVLAVVKPKVLAPFNHLWLKLGSVLYKVVNPIVMALLFYLTILPVGLLMRLFGKDPLGLKCDRRRSSYWIERRPPGPAPDTMRNQF